MEVSVLYKFLWIPALTVLAFFAKHYFHALEKKNEALSKKQDEIEKNIINLEMELNKNYYDKREIKEHIVLPLMAHSSLFFLVLAYAFFYLHRCKSSDIDYPFYIMLFIVYSIIQ